MDETRQTNSAAANSDTGAQKTAARQEDATSGDTLSDLQQKQTDSAASEGATSGSSDSSSAPSPDGTPDNTGGGTADGRDSGGPM